MIVALKALALANNFLGYCIELRTVTTRVTLVSYQSLLKKCSYSKFFWSVFSRMLTEYGKMLNISTYSVEMWENTDQKTTNTDTFHAVSYSYKKRL